MTHFIRRLLAIAGVTTASGGAFAALNQVPPPTTVTISQHPQFQQEVAAQTQAAGQLEQTLRTTSAVTTQLTGKETQIQQQLTAAQQQLAQFQSVRQQDVGTFAQALTAPASSTLSAATSSAPVVHTVTKASGHSSDDGGGGDDGSGDGGGGDD